MKGLSRAALVLSAIATALSSALLVVNILSVKKSKDISELL